MRNGTSGFSLLEIIVSLVILSALAAGIFSTVHFAKRVSIQAQQKAIAVSYIESRLSELKSIGADKLDESKDVDRPDVVDLALIQSGSCVGIEGGKESPYCVPINEFNGRMKGLVMAKVSDDPSSFGFKQIWVVAKWIDFTLPGHNRIRTESAVTGVSS